MRPRWKHWPSCSPRAVIGRSLRRMVNAPWKLPSKNCRAGRSPHARDRWPHDVPWPSRNQFTSQSYAANLVDECCAPIDRGSPSPRGGRNGHVEETLRRGGILRRGRRTVRRRSAIGFANTFVNLCTCRMNFMGRFSRLCDHGPNCRTQQCASHCFECPARRLDG